MSGRVWRFGDNVDTDVIIPARYLNVSEPSQLAAHCMEDADPGFASRVQPGDVVVAGRNFGCGSSREHAPIALKAAGVAAVVADSFARIFYRNAINIGLPIFECPEAVRELKEGERVSVDPPSGRITSEDTGRSFAAEPFPEFMQDIIRFGGLIPYVRQRIKQQDAEV